MTEKVRGLVGQLQVSGLADRGKLSGDLLRGLPGLAPLSLAERSPAAGAQAGQVGLFGLQVLCQDDLLPLVFQERWAEVEARVAAASAQRVRSTRSSTITGLPRACLTML